MITISREKAVACKQSGWWGEESTNDLFKKHVAAKPQQLALVDPPNTMAIYGREPKRLSWAEAEGMVARYTAMFVKHGLKKDDALIVQMPNCVELSIVYLACARLGVIASPVPALYRDNELINIAEQLAAKAIITASRIGKYDHESLALRLQQKNPSIVKVFCIGDIDSSVEIVDVEKALDSLNQEDLAAASAAINESAVLADEVFTVCWTSGTESSPKGVPRNHNEWLAISRIVVVANEVGDGAHILNPFPMVNMAGFAASFYPWLLSGGVLVQHHPFDLNLFIQQIRDENITSTSAPPAVLNLLLQNEEMLHGIDFKLLKTIGSGSAPLSEWMVKGYQDKFNVCITNLFGSNEGTALVSSLQTIPDPVLRAKYLPRPLEGGESASRYGFITRIVNPDTEEEITKTGEVGELRIKGPTVFSGYWKNPEATRCAFDTEGWFKTGDLFQISGEQQEFLQFSSRLKDILIRGGMNISPVEIETLLLAHPVITAAAVVGLPDKILGERVCAFVEIKKGHSADIDAINTFLREEKGLAVFKQIERLEVVDALPRNPVGKVLKTILREELV
jgi:acyl-CoA synthetase (AMP-forming)/AMP-acid ligase II